MHRRRAVAVLLARGLLALVMLAACSNGGGGDENRNNASDGTTDDAAASTTATTTRETTSTTISPLSPIANCPEAPPLAEPDPHRPRYSATVDIDPVAGVVTGELTTTFTPDLDTDVLVFRLWANSPRYAMAGVTMEAGDVHHTGGDDALVVDRPDATTMIVRLGTRISRTKTVEVTMPFTLSIPATVSDRVSHSGDTLRLGSFLPLLAWEPGIGWTADPPTRLFAEAVTSPVADYDVAVTLPAGYDALGSGRRDPDGHFRATAIRDFALSVGHFTLVTSTQLLPEPVEVTVGVDNSLREKAATYLDRVTKSLRSYASRFGAYPWTTLSVAITPGLEGGIEFPTHIMQGPQTTGRTTPHEVAHQWFYSLVGNDQGRDPWLDEGLASYAEYTFEGSLGTNVGRDIPADALGHAGEPMTYWNNHGDSYYAGVYRQPAVAVGLLGEQDRVDCALRQYVARNAFAIARPADLLDALATVFPEAKATLETVGLTAK